MTSLLQNSCVFHVNLCSLCVSPNMWVSFKRAWMKDTERRGEDDKYKDIECCLALDKDMALCRRLVKAAEDESESSPLTGALVVRSPVWFHLVSLAQGKFKKKKFFKTLHRKSFPCPHLDIFLSIKSPRGSTIISCPKIKWNHQC